MPRIELALGESVVVTFKDTDGEITVAFIDPDVTFLPESLLVNHDESGASQLPRMSGVVVHADMADASGREGIVYHEPLSPDGCQKNYTTTDEG